VQAVDACAFAERGDAERGKLFKGYTDRGEVGTGGGGIDADLGWQEEEGGGGRDGEGEDQALISDTSASNHIPLLLEKPTGTYAAPAKSSATNSIGVASSTRSRGNQRRRQSVWQSLMQGNNLLRLAVTGGSWFLYDICYFGVALFGAQILDAVYGGSSDSDSSGDDVTTDGNIRATTWHEMVVLFMAIPGTLFSIYLMSKMNTRNLQMAGFGGTCTS